MLSDHQYEMIDFIKDQEFINELLNRYNIEGPFPFNLFINANNDIINESNNIFNSNQNNHDNSSMMAIKNFNNIPNSERIQLKRATDILQTLLKSRAREVSLKKEMTDKLTDLNQELQIKQSSIDRLKSQLENSQTELEQSQNKLINTIQKMDKMERIVSISKEEVGKIKLAHQTKSRQFMVRMKFKLSFFIIFPI